MIHDLRLVWRDGKRILQYNTCAAGDSRDWHDVELAACDHRQLMGQSGYPNVCQDCGEEAP